MDIIDIYVDGSYSKDKHNVGHSSWAYIVVQKDKVIYKDKGVLYGEINSMWQIGGEITAVIESVKYCIKNNLKARIYFDYIGLRSWVHDLFGKEAWKCKNKFTKEYREFMFTNKEYIYEMIKVKSHSGNKFNEIVDKLAKL